MTSKRQVTIPKAVADRYGIKPGDRIRWIPAGDEIRVVPVQAFGAGHLSREDRLELFDRASERRDQNASSGMPKTHGADGERGWTRDSLYDRGRSD